jgi:hypothetical protein
VILDSAMSQFAATVPQDVDLETSDAVVAGEIVLDGGYFRVRWDFKGDLSGLPLDCVQAGVDTIVVASRDVSGAMTTFQDQFACSLHKDTTHALPAGMYTVTVSALAGMMMVATAPPISPATITAPNQITDLGGVVLSIPNR